MEKSQKPNRKNFKDKPKDDIESKIVSIRRVTRVYKGGKRMRLSVFVVVGNKNGKVGVGIGKGADVKTAEMKAIAQAKRNMLDVNIKGNTIPHEIKHKRGAAKVLLKPASPGTGVIAGSSVRSVLELAGVKDILTKIIGTNNKINNTYATVEALSLLVK